MRRGWTRTSGLVLLAVVAAGCGGGVDDAEEQLAENFLDPLADAGITTVVEDTCRYGGMPVEGVWHLQTHIRLHAPKEEVIDALAEGGGVFIESDREPRPVWQEGTQPGGGGGWPGEGRYGWHGSVSAEGAESVLRVVFNNAEHDGLEGVTGWAEVCPGM
ncbi:hypothetical protein CLV92_102324 [Kineococcus xinjiangensis]|uniref:Lipoprotein n=1 Tax=Kineococcus xinjiangensis TaxID=512762 RepID=A0A2S6IV82_9ACTN|nr:hypothetical protein [Kineococcus xinjiangensis]PPK98171.1 hypothetical protein CLV92_102324 [Kineococcus xinjiangensis]